MDWYSEFDKKLSPKKEKHKLFTDYLSQLNNLKESGDIAFAMTLPKVFALY